MAHHEMPHEPNNPADYQGADAQYFETPTGAGSEHTDARVWTIVKFGLWLMVSAVVVHVGLGLMYAMLKEQSMDLSQPRYPLAAGIAPALPAQPRLQQVPANEIYELRLAEGHALQGYAWVDKAAGTVRIPIVEAMRLTVERGLPARAEQSASGRSGLLASDASSGRVMERRGQ